MVQCNKDGVPLEKGRESITLYTPQDGGTPRDATRIVEVGSGNSSFAPVLRRV